MHTGAGPSALSESQTSGMLTLVSSERLYNGHQNMYEHDSKVLQCRMRLGIYIPINAQKLPCLMCLGGLTSTIDSWIDKSDVQRKSSEMRMVNVFPDTSPRGVNVPNVETDEDVGYSAGWYIDATKEPWSTNYNMFSYITKELPKLLTIWTEDVSGAIDVTKLGITGFSMGGHGALIAYLQKNSVFKSCSALAPVCNAAAPGGYGHKAFSHYFQDPVKEGRENSATTVIKNWQISDTTKPRERYVLIDTGEEDEYMPQIIPETLKQAAEGTSVHVQSRIQPGFNHSYNFVRSFADQHVEHHSNILNPPVKVKKSKFNFGL